MSNSLLNVSNNEFEKMSVPEKKEYYNKLRNYCIDLGKEKQKISFGQKFIHKYNSKIRNFDFEFIGEEKIPNDGAIILVNHSNSHDIINFYEVLTEMGLNGSVLLTKEGLSPLILSLFKNANATVIDRFDKKLSSNGVYELANKVLNKNTGVVFGEGTWNLHPVKPMQNIKIGAAKVSAISQKPVIPTIMEYIEVPTLCDKESELYKKCVISFGEPIYISDEKSLVIQTNNIQSIMEKMRKDIWSSNDIKRDSLDDINPILYINHTWLKEYDGLANGFDASVEDKVLFSKDGSVPENEYYIDSFGNFVPKTIPKKSLIRR